jgi:hypothetical protein
LTLQNAKVTIKISDRAKMDPMTHEREVAISGSLAAVQLACAMIGEKLTANRARGGGFQSDGGEDDGFMMEEAGPMVNNALAGPLLGGSSGGRHAPMMHSPGGGSGMHMHGPGSSAAAAAAHGLAAPHSMY